MLDQQLKSQLQSYLQNLRNPIELIASLDNTEPSTELRQLLQDIASLSDKVTLNLNGSDSRLPSFVIVKQGETRGVRFAAIPMGHEFTSLVLALLWTGGHPPKADPEVIEQIKAIDRDIACAAAVGNDIGGSEFERAGARIPDHIVTKVVSRHGRIHVENDLAGIFVGFETVVLAEQGESAERKNAGESAPNPKAFRK